MPGPELQIASSGGPDLISPAMQDRMPDRMLEQMPDRMPQRMSSICQKEIEYAIYISR